MIPNQIDNDAFFQSIENAPMTEVELSAEETKSVYKQICDAKLEPFNIEYDEDCSEFYYELNGKKYRLIYDRAGDWFCDIIYQGDY